MHGCGLRLQVAKPSEAAEPDERKPEVSAKRPNILLFFTDQQRADTIGALGNPVIRTPAMDRFCREGVAFDRCFTPSPVCVSARCSLVTGLPPHKTGCCDNGIANPQDVPSFMERLADAGYQTHGVGKMHFHPDSKRMWGFESRDFSEEAAAAMDFREFLKANGYDYVMDPHGVRSEMYYIPQPSQLPARLHNTTWVADKSIEFLKRRDRKRPFFLWTSFIKPHPPFESPVPWNKLYRTAEMAPPHRPEGFENLLTYWNRVQNRYKYRDHGYDELLVRTIRAAYYACVSFIDYNVGRVLEALGDETDDTLIVFTSDHGEMLGDYGSFGKRCMLDAAARVPLIARWPGQLPAGLRCGTPASLQDLWRTFLTAGGADDSGPDARDSVNLVELASDSPPRDAVFSQFQQGQHAAYLAATATQKYVFSAPDQREWFFDASDDPAETRDRAGNPRYNDGLAELRRRLIRRFQADGYTEPLDGDGWREHPRLSMPANPDAGLLFQDTPDLQARIDALGPYARKVTVGPKGSLGLLDTKGKTHK